MGKLKMFFASAKLDATRVELHTVLKNFILKLKCYKFLFYKHKLLNFYFSVVQIVMIF